MKAFLLKFKWWIGGVAALVIGTGSVFGAIKTIKDSEFRPVIKIELVEEKEDILKEVQKNVDRLDIELIAGKLERWDNKIQGLEAQQYQLWKDEKKLGPTPEIQRRKRAIEKNIKVWQRRIEEEEKREQLIRKRRGR